MRLVFSKSICKAEFGQLSVPEPHLQTLQRSRAVELTTSIKGEGLPKGTRLLKIYATSPEGARRIVHLLAVEDETLFLLFYRDKKDPVGKNITIKNPHFRKQLHKHLHLLHHDLQSGEYEVWEE